MQSLNIVNVMSLMIFAVYSEVKALIIGCIFLLILVKLKGDEGSTLRGMKRKG